MPRSFRITIVAVIAAICAGAVWLMAARGSAILLDLSNSASKVFCF